MITGSKHAHGSIAYAMVCDDFGVVEKLSISAFQRRRIRLFNDFKKNRHVRHTLQPKPRTLSGDYAIFINIWTFYVEKTPFETGKKLEMHKHRRKCIKIRTSVYISVFMYLECRIGLVDFHTTEKRRNRNTTSTRSQYGLEYRSIPNGF